VDAETREYFLAWSRTEEHRARVEESLEFLGTLRGKRVYVAFSGGKDSICTLHLSYRVLGPGIEVFHWDHGPWLVPRPVEDELQRIMRAVAPKAVHIVRTGKALQGERARWDYRAWYRAFFGTLEKLRVERGWEVGLLGLRGEEGVRRRLRTGEWCELRGGVALCYPIRRWTWRDVWAYIVSNGLPYPSVYDAYAPLVGWDRARLVTFFDREFEHYGNQVDGYLMWRYKHGTGLKNYVFPRAC